MSEELQIADSVNEAPVAIELQERAQVDVQISTARRFPRTLSKVKADMLSFATLDEETAQSCFYTLPRGGKVIQGPSIRMAEIAISCYGNVRVATRVVGTVTNGENPHVTVQAAMHDLERNVAVQIEKRRRIVGKKSKGGKIDEDDINLAVNACSAIAFRDAAFKVIPQALIKPVYEQAKKVAVGDVSSVVVKRTKIVDKLKQMGATEERILARVDAAKVEDVGLDKLEVLIGLGTALKDGETSLEEAFPVAIKAAKVTAKEDDVPFSFGEQAPKQPVAGSVPAAGSPTAAPVEQKPAEKPAVPAQSELPVADDSSSPVEKLTRMASVAGITWDAVEAWAKQRKLDANKDADATKIINAWSTVSAALAAKGGKAS